MESKVVRFPASSDGGVIEHLLAGGEIIAAQLPVASHWSREKKLAAAAFTSGLINIRDNTSTTSRRRAREVAEDVGWVMSDDATWPYSFVRLCELFSLSPDWVRERVVHWIEEPQPRSGRRFSAHRHAA